MISVCITSFNEESTITKVVELWTKQKYPTAYEIIPVVGGNSVAALKKAERKFKGKHVKSIYEDKPEGKPNALRKFWKKSKGDICIMTDGDVFPEPGAVEALVAPFKDKRIGLVSGRVIPLNKKTNILGYWQYVLTDVIHKLRSEAARKGTFVFATGYLYALRHVIKEIPKNSLSDDGVVSHTIFDMGYRTTYAPNAIIRVKYPTTLSDWIKQKRRTSAGYYQIAAWFPKHKSRRSFASESSGAFRVLSYAKTPKEFFWILSLFLLRAYVWILAFYDLGTKKFGDIWKPIATTK